MDNSDEPGLIAQARDDPAAFIILYERYVECIYAFAFRGTHDEALASDVTSATFEKALRHIRRYRWHGISFGAWLYKIARNEIAQHYRRFVLPLGDNMPMPIDIEQTVQSNQQQQSLYAALKRLSHKDREIITLRYLDDLSSAEVAQILGCSVDNAYLRLHRALSRLRKELERLDYSEVIYAQE